MLAKFIKFWGSFSLTLLELLVLAIGRLPWNFRSDAQLGCSIVVFLAALGIALVQDTNFH